MSTSVPVLLCLMGRFITDNALAFFLLALSVDLGGPFGRDPLACCISNAYCRHPTSAEILIPLRRYTWGNKVEGVIRSTLDVT